MKAIEKTKAVHGKAEFRFSFGWFIGVALLHLAGTLLLGLIAFGAAMSSFTQRAAELEDTLDAIGVISWLWSPLPMALARHGLSIEGGLWICHILWSLLVGFAAGVIVPRLKPAA